MKESSEIKMNLEKLKKYKDEYCTKFVLKQIDFIKKYFNIPFDKRVFWLERWCGRDYFLCGNRVFIVEFEYDKERNCSFSSLYIANIDEDIVLEAVIPSDGIPKFRIWRDIQIDETKYLYTKEEFLTWYNSPVQINTRVNVPHSKAIEFLQKYKKTTFKTDRYLFYVKRDNDLTFTFFIYAKDLKTDADLKIYTNIYYTNIYESYPQDLRDIFVEDFSGKLSKYQLRQCKKEFLAFCKETCEELKAPNYYAVEFVKQCVQPIEFDGGWFVTDVFSGDFEFENIWIDDFLLYDEKPYFLLCKTKPRRKIMEIAAIDFYKPEYKSTGIYNAGLMKRNHWNVDKETLERLVKFFKEPFDRTKCNYKYYDDSKITNWQHMIEVYNDNTGSSFDKELPMDLPIPDYTKLAE